MKAFKLIKVDQVKRYWSFLVKGLACVEYRIGEWTSAPNWLAEKGYHLFVYPDLKSIQEVVTRHCLEGKIFECEILLGETRPLPQKLQMSALADGVILENSFKWPSDTIMVEHVKLIKEIT